MPIGLLGKKLGMTHVYDEYGRRMAVTAIQAGPCTVTRVREPQRDGYCAIQVGFESVPEAKVTKPLRGQFKSAGTSCFRYVREFRLSATREARQAGLPRDTITASKTGDEESARDAWKAGQQLTVDLFKPYELVDVTGMSIGKGFQGGMKRWHWRGGGASHGSTSHRAPGSIGSTTTPGRVWRGHHLPGHMGDDRVTVQNVRVVRLDPAHHLLLIEGAIPGAKQGLVMVTKSQKRPGVIRPPQAFQTVIDEEEEAMSKKAAKKK